MIIPVFFLSSFPVSAQFPVQEAGMVSLGRSYSATSGISSTTCNQAGLGWVKENTVYMHQAMPLLAGDLTFSSIGVQCAFRNGGIGTNLSLLGFPGCYQSSLWLSCGLRLFPGVSAGLGIHVSNTGIQGRFFHHTEGSFALGIQVRPGADWILGGHVMHPAAWSAGEKLPEKNRMMIGAGFSNRFFLQHTFYGDFHLMPGRGLQLCCGIRSLLCDRVALFLGFHNLPCAVSGGIECTFNVWTLQFAFEYLTGNGSTPHATLAYEW